MDITEVIFTRLTKLGENRKNAVIWYERSQRHTKQFCEVWKDIVELLSTLQTGNAKRVGILGPTCYNWLVIDLACLLGGIQTVAFPEGLSKSEVEQLITENPVDVLFVHDGFRERVASLSISKVMFANHGNLTSGSAAGQAPENRIRVDYTVVFSSGSTGLPKRFVIRLLAAKYKRDGSDVINRQFDRFVGSRSRLWKRRGNKIIVFMPFSHLQQRQFAWRALLTGFDLLLSTPVECLLHTMRERPNIIVSVPSFFELIGAQVEEELGRFGTMRGRLLDLLNACAVNRMDRRNPLRILYDSVVVGSRITSLYGGRPDLFITGSAPISDDRLRTLWRVGISVYNVYSQTEVGIISVNTPSCHRLGSVGKPFQDVRISDEGEILVRFNEDMHDPTTVEITSDGYVRTGDLGRFDADGFLYYSGRKNSVLVLKSGKKVHPETVESRFRAISGVREAVLYETSEGLTLGLVLGAGMNTPALLTAVKQLRKALAEHEQPRALYSIDAGVPATSQLWTATGKLIRKNAAQVFATEREISLS